MTINKLTDAEIDEIDELRAAAAGHALTYDVSMRFAHTVFEKWGRIEAELRFAEVMRERIRVLTEALGMFADENNWRTIVLGASLDYVFRHDTEPNFNGPAHERAADALSKAEAPAPTSPPSREGSTDR